MYLCFPLSHSLRTVSFICLPSFFFFSSAPFVVVVLCEYDQRAVFAHDSDEFMVPLPRSLPHSSFRFPRDGVVTTTGILLAQMSEAKMSLTVEAFADGIKFDNFSSKSRSNVNTLSELDH